MNASVYIRPLRLEDALVSCEWRNNPRLWKYTGSRPDRHITPEIETAWLREKLETKDEMRFAICLRSDDLYIGNSILTHIENGEAQYHIFIGNMQFWGGKRAYEAVVQTFEYGFNELDLDLIWMEVNHNNVAAIKICENMGFKKTGEINNNFEKYIFTREMFNNKEHHQWEARYKTLPSTK